MKKFVFVLMISVICVTLASCGSASKKEDVRVKDGYQWSERAKEAMNWDVAKEYCENLNEKDFSDWRLPNPKEMSKIYLESHSSVFGDTDQFWTSEEINENRARTFEFSFARVEATSKENKFAVYCVRDNE